MRTIIGGKRVKAKGRRSHAACGPEHAHRTGISGITAIKKSEAMEQGYGFRISSEGREIYPGTIERPHTHVRVQLNRWMSKKTRKATGALALHATVMHGIGFVVASALKEDLDINDKQMAEALGTSESTFLRWRKGQKDLDEIASDRLVRYARIVEMATEVFEDKHSAQSWLKRPQVGLGDRIPLDMMKSEVGAREVENLLMRIEHGVLA